MRTRKMTNKQLQIYGARIKLAWFRKAEELGSVTAACKFYGIPRSEYYYWHKRWTEGDKRVTALYDKPRTPKSRPRDLGGDEVNLIVSLRLQTGYGERALEAVLKRDYGLNISHHGIGNVLKRAGLTVLEPKRTELIDSLMTIPTNQVKSDKWMLSTGNEQPTNTTS